MKTVNILAAVSATALIAACSASEAVESDAPVAATTVTEATVEELQGGVIATQMNGSREVQFFAIDESGQAVMQPAFTVTMPSPPAGDAYRVSFSPDAQAQRVLIADCDKGGVPDMRIYNSRTGALVTDMTDGFMAQLREETRIDIGDVDLVETWWTGADEVVVQVAVSREDGSEVDDLLLRYDLTGHTDGEMAQIADFTRFPIGTVPTAAPGGFTPQAHEHDAGYRLAAANGAIEVDGLAIEGGPAAADHVTGVVNIPIAAGA